MNKNHGFPIEDLPDLPHARQLQAGIPWLTFDAALESEFLASHLTLTLPHIRINLFVAIAIAFALCIVDSFLLGHALNRFVSIILLGVAVPTLLAALAASFVPRLLGRYLLIAAAAVLVAGSSMVLVEIRAAQDGVQTLFPALILTTLFIYFMGGLLFYRALAVNVFLTLAFVAAGTVLALPIVDLSYDFFSLAAVNVFCASVVYMHEKTSRLRFLEAALLQDMVARDGLTGIHNRRMFDQQIARIWQQGVRDGVHVAVMLVDIDCFKHYNDRYGHQAGDQCLRAVARALSQCARRPMDFVARYGGEEFAVVLGGCTREYAADVMNRIQRAIAQLGVAHEASPVANRLTVSIGAAFALPGADRTPQGLVQLADEALYSAKEHGRNKVVIMEAEYQNLRTGKFDKRRRMSKTA